MTGNLADDEVAPSGPLQINKDDFDLGQKAKPL